MLCYDTEKKTMLWEAVDKCLILVDDYDNDDLKHLLEIIANELTIEQIQNVVSALDSQTRHDGRVGFLPYDKYWHHCDDCWYSIMNDDHKLVCYNSFGKHGCQVIPDPENDYCKKWCYCPRDFGYF